LKLWDLVDAHNQEWLCHAAEKCNTIKKGLSSGAEVRWERAVYVVA